MKQKPLQPPPHPPQVFTFKESTNGKIWSTYLHWTASSWSTTAHTHTLCKTSLHKIIKFGCKSQNLLVWRTRNSREAQHSNLMLGSCSGRCSTESLHWWVPSLSVTLAIVGMLGHLNSSCGLLVTEMLLLEVPDDGAPQTIAYDNIRVPFNVVQEPVGGTESGSGGVGGGGAWSGVISEEHNLNNCEAELRADGFLLWVNPFNVYAHRFLSLKANLAIIMVAGGV